MDPWKIIGWLILIVFIVTPVLRFIVLKVTHLLTWNSQKWVRQRTPRQYSRWQSLSGKNTYYINRVYDNGSIMASSDPNNNGGTSYSKEQWDKLVEHEKLVKL